MNITPEKLEFGFLSTHCSEDAILKAVEAGINEQSFSGALTADIWKYLVENVTSGNKVSVKDVNAVFDIELKEDLVDQEVWLNNLLEISVARQARTILSDEIPNLDSKPAKTIQNIIVKFGELAHPTVSKTFYYDRDALLRLEKYLQSKTKVKEGAVLGTLTGLEIFDKKLGPIRDGELVAIIGRHNIGKSSLLAFFCSIGFLQGKRVLYLSPESSVEDVSARFDILLARQFGYDSFTINDITKRTAGEDYENFLKELASKNTDNLLIRDAGDAGSFTILDVLTYAREFKPDILAIDGFHLIDGGEDSWQSMKRSAQAVKGLALSMNIVVYTVAQVQRDAVQAKDEIPELGKSAYGMGLEETADKVIALGNKRGDPTQRIWKMPKNRNGPEINDRQYLNFDIKRGIIGDVDLEGLLSVDDLDII